LARARAIADLVVHVETEDLQLRETDTEAVLQGKTFGGQAIQGTDSVRVARRRHPHGHDG
jgi:hypothetical protein